MPPKRVAIVGSGCAGIGALWALKDTEHEVHLFEADETLGGHTNTVKWKHDGKEVDVDTGFIVYNTATYPNFIKFLQCLGVETAPTQMTFGVSRNKGELEWSGTSLATVFAQWSNLFSLRFWRMLFDVVRFNQYALDLLYEEEQEEDESDDGAANGASIPNGDGGKSSKRAKPRSRKPSRAGETIGEYLYKEGYSNAFRDDYLIPMTAAVWSTSPEKAALEFPATTLVRFMWNHHLLSTVSARPEWRTIPGGSKKYIDAALDGFPRDRIHLRKPVAGIEDINGKVILQFEEDEDLFDHIILACHGDQACQIISDSGTEEERSILGNFHTTQNVAYLHSDLSLMPRSRSAWSAWNLLTTTTPSPSHTPAPVTLTYNMNILQHIPARSSSDVLVTLNPPSTPKSTQGIYHYAHPLYTRRAVGAQKQLPRIQNTRGISYAGAWTRYGFHEDGFTSGVSVAVEHLGGEVPWDIVDSRYVRGKRPKMSWRAWVGRWGIWYVSLWVRGVEIAWKVVWWPVVGVWRVLGGVSEGNKVGVCGEGVGEREVLLEKKGR